jgi:hypothetical protein
VKGPRWLSNCDNDDAARGVLNLGGTCNRLTATALLGGEESLVWHASGDLKTAKLETAADLEIAGAEALAVPKEDVAVPQLKIPSARADFGTTLDEVVEPNDGAVRGGVNLLAVTMLRRRTGGPRPGGSRFVNRPGFAISVARLA